MSSGSIPSPVAETPAGPQRGPKAAETSAKQPSKASRHRFKPQLSCNFCRTRKLKCDRNLPCQNCTKRDLSASCTYVHAGQRRDKSSSIHKPNGNPRDVQNQISHLEELVVSLMNKSKAIANLPKSTEPPPSSLDENCPTPELTSGSLEDQWTEINTVNSTVESVGRISIQDEQPNYVGSAHWEAILDNIACLKDTLEDTKRHQEEKPIEAVSRGPDLLVGAARKVSRAEIIAALPPKRIVDELVLKFFSVSDLGCAILHEPSFHKQYDKFWADPSCTPITWIGMLFSMLCLAIQLEVLTNQGSFTNWTDFALREPAEVMDMCREKTVQCLILGNYTEPGPYTLETLMLYYVTEHFRLVDVEFGSWMVFSLIVRVALRLGLHRDASHYPKISILQGEMQRRIWSSIVYLDIQTSCQVGLPRMIKDGTYDTKSPRDLLDKDFDENTKVLPPSRPESDLTTCAYLNNKHRITKVFGTIVDQSNSTGTIGYDEAMRLDKRLHDVYLNTPEPFKIRSVEDLNVGSIDTRIRKFGADLVFQKARCILHRKFFILSKPDGSYIYPYSTKTCVEASVRILQCQVYLHKETRPGRVLHDQKWKTSSLMSNDFILAAMLLCLYLGHGMAVESLGRQMAETGIRIKWSREAMLDILNESYEIFEETRGTSKSSFKAADALKAMLTKVRNTPGTPTSSQAQVAGASTVSEMPDSVAPPTAPKLPSQTWYHDSFNRPLLPWMEPPSFEGQDIHADTNSPQQSNDMNQVMLGAMELDWELWDNQFYHQGTLKTPPDQLDFDASVPLPELNAVSMQWEQ